MEEYCVQFWMYSGKEDDYIDHEHRIMGIDEEDALKETKKLFPRGKNFKIFKDE